MKGNRYNQPKPNQSLAKAKRPEPSPAQPSHSTQDKPSQARKCQFLRFARRLASYLKNSCTFALLCYKTWPCIQLCLFLTFFQSLTFGSCEQVGEATCWHCYTRKELAPLIFCTMLHKKRLVGLFQMFSVVPRFCVCYTYSNTCKTLGNQFAQALTRKNIGHTNFATNSASHSSENRRPKS